MKIILQAAIVITAIWAAASPFMYGLLFAAGFHWSALVDFTVVLACTTLVITAFKKISFAIWLFALTALSLSVVSDLAYQFKDSGESGPLPFEWLNSYRYQGVPLLLVALLTRILPITKKPNKAEMATPRKPSDQF